MGVHQQQKGVAHHQVAPLVRAADEIAGQAHPKAADIAVLPVLRSSPAPKPRTMRCPESPRHESHGLEKLAASKDRLRRTWMAARTKSHQARCSSVNCQLSQVSS